MKPRGCSYDPRVKWLVLVMVAALGCKKVPKQAVAKRETPIKPVPPEPRKRRPPPPAPLPARRQAGDLVVLAQPPAADDRTPFRLRSQTNGSLSKGDERMWAGIPVPIHVELMIGTQELFLLDAFEDQLFALYRDPYGASTCELSTDTNCGFTARLYDVDGTVAWTIPLNPLMALPEDLEVQDIQYDGRLIYFNEACQSFAADADGKCSSLVAVDPITRTVAWRTAPLTSNDEFLLAGRYIVCGYGFSDEADHLFVVRRSDGVVMQKVGIPDKHTLFERVPPDRVRVVLSGRKDRMFQLIGFDGPDPRLELIP